MDELVLFTKGLCKYIKLRQKRDLDLMAVTHPKTVEKGAT